MSPASPRFDGTHALKCELATEVLRSSGTLRLQVTGWSMLPAVWPGDTLVVNRAHGDSISEGDIVLFGRERRLFAHRVVKKCAREILTRGDAMLGVDRPVAHSQLLGKVSFILRGGRCTEPSRNPRLAQRAVAALVRNSEIAARVVVGVHNMSQPSLM